MEEQTLKDRKRRGRRGSRVPPPSLLSPLLQVSTVRMQGVILLLFSLGRGVVEGVVMRGEQHAQPCSAHPRLSPYPDLS